MTALINCKFKQFVASKKPKSSQHIDIENSKQMIRYLRKKRKILLKSMCYQEVNNRKATNKKSELYIKFPQFFCQQPKQIQQIEDSDLNCYISYPTKNEQIYIRSQPAIEQSNNRQYNDEKQQLDEVIIKTPAEQLACYSQFQIQKIKVKDAFNESWNDFIKSQIPGYSQYSSRIFCLNQTKIIQLLQNQNQQDD